MFSLNPSMLRKSVPLELDCWHFFFFYLRKELGPNNPAVGWGSGATGGVVAG